MAIKTTRPKNVEIILTTSQVAEMLHVAYQSLANERHLGKSKIPFVRIGKKIVYRHTDIQAYLDANTVSQS